MLELVQRVFFGPLREPPHGSDQRPVRDLCLREVMALAPLVVFVVWIGIQPRFFLDRMAPTIDPLADNVSAAVEEEWAATADRGVASCQLSVARKSNKDR
jgi:NADH-quinone oxidoreductase subunit M